MSAPGDLIASLRGDLALVNEIPLYAIPDDVPFTLDQHLAFGRITEALPKLIAAVEAAQHQSHLDSKGVGLGTSGWHEPGKCRLCDALRGLADA